MSFDIDPIEERIEGDALKIPFIVKDGDSSNNRKDITGSSISWDIRDDRLTQPDITDQTSGVNINITDAQNGEFHVKIDTDVTDSLSGGRDIQVVQIEDQNGNKSTSMGVVRLTGLEQ